MAATARLIVMMDPKQKHALEKRAKAADLPMAELVRQRLNDAPTPDEAAFYEALAELGARIENINADIGRSVQRIAAREAASALRVSSYNASKELSEPEIAALAAWLQPAFAAVDRAAAAPAKRGRRA